MLGVLKSKRDTQFMIDIFFVRCQNKVDLLFVDIFASVTARRPLSLSLGFMFQ
jgi:hypothetical protein